jgi:membrane protease YdiL (CAAX protease family)
MRVVAAYIALIAVAEASVAFGNPLIGAIVYSILLVVMLTHCAVRLAAERGPGEEQRKPKPDPAHAVAALAFLPVIRLVSMSVPVGGSSEASQSLVVGASLLAAIVWAAWGVRLPASRLRPRFPASDLLVVCLAPPLAYDAYVVLRPASLAEGAQWTQLGTAALAVALAAVVEELVFRGFIQTAFFRLYGSSAPLWATAVYVISYLGVRPMGMIALAALLGLLFGWLVQRSGSLLGVTVSHALVNIGLFVLLPHALSDSPA